MGKLRYKYILVPGKVSSKHDGDLHFIDAITLARLYGVSMADCITYKEYGWNIGYGDITGLPILEPRYDGDYKVSNCRKAGVGFGTITERILKNRLVRSSQC